MEAYGEFSTRNKPTNNQGNAEKLEVARSGNITEQLEVKTRSAHKSSKRDAHQQLLQVSPCSLGFPQNLGRFLVQNLTLLSCFPSSRPRG